MRPGDLISFMLLGIGVLIVILFIFFILRKRKKLAIVLTIPLIISYCGYFIFFPTIQENTHAKRYQQLEAYLSTTYPEKHFVISPQHFEQGVNVGDFEVHHLDTPEIGVTLRVKKDGSVSQVATWTNSDYPTQQELWRNLQTNFLGDYALDKEIPEIKKIDTWIDGELTVFALTIDDKHSIAIFTYSNAGYSLLEVTEGERGEIVTAEYENYMFIYIDEHYAEDTATIHLKSGDTYSINVFEQKGQLIVNKNQKQGNIR